jgi:hypothetical protein
LIKLYLKKNHNFILKGILGVHSKSSNLAVRIDSVLFPSFSEYINYCIHVYIITDYRKKNVLNKEDLNLFLQHAYIEDKKNLQRRETLVGNTAYKNYWMISLAQTIQYR